MREQPVQTGHADIHEPVGVDTEGCQGRTTLLEDRNVSGSRRRHEHTVVPGGGQSPSQDASSFDHIGMGVAEGGLLGLVHPGHENRSGSVLEEFTHDRHAVFGGLPRAVDDLGKPLAQVTMMIHEGVSDLGERKPGETGDSRVDIQATIAYIGDQLLESGGVHAPILPRGTGRALAWRIVAITTRIGFLGPLGTFTEQALLSQEDLAGREHVPYPTVPDVLDAIRDGEVAMGLVPIENSIEGTVNFTQDALAFDHDLLIQREVEIDIEHCLVARPGTVLTEIERVLSIPVATAQCHGYLRRTLSGVELEPAASTAAAAQSVAAATSGPPSAAIAPRTAAERYGLEILAAGIEDQPGNRTRFFLVGPEGIPAPTGHDRTAIVVYQRADEPGSLISILQEFAARRVNLSNLISRPTKHGGLGDYCFVIYAEGHIADELVADALRALHAKQGRVKFLGSYPTARAEAISAREHADQRWREADDWVAELRSGVRPSQ